MKRRDFHRLLIYGTAATQSFGRMALSAPAPKIVIVPLKEEHVQDAAVLLTKQHLANRQREPALPSIDYVVARMAEFRAERGRPAYDETAGLLPFPTSPRPGQPAVAAFKDGQLVGYLKTSELENNRAYTGMQNLAVDPVDGDQIYREMYAAVAQQWLDQRYSVHFVKVFASDKQAIETWFSLGFGQVSTQVFRDTNYIHENAAGIEVVPARAEHIELLVQLQAEHRRYESETPIFIPAPAESATSDRVEAQREGMEALLRDPDSRIWVAFQNGNPAGMMSLQPAAGTGLSPLLHLTRMVFAGDALTGEAARDPNVRGVLLDTALNWARGQGYERVYAVYHAADTFAHQFWVGIGFQPVAYWLMRALL